MKILALIITLFISCHVSFAQQQYFKLKPMEGYFLDSKVPLTEGANFFVITNRRKFIKYFGLINKPDTPNFDFDHVIVMALPPSKKQSLIGFLPTAAKAGNFIEVYCVLEKDKYPVTYTSHAIVAARIPRYFSVTKVNFYEAEKKKLLESVPIR